MEGGNEKMNCFWIYVLVIGDCFGQFERLDAGNGRAHRMSGVQKESTH